MLLRDAATLLFGVGERDPITFTLVALLPGAVALGATTVPAIRGVRVDRCLPSDPSRRYDRGIGELANWRVGELATW